MAYKSILFLSVFILITFPQEAKAWERFISLMETIFDEYHEAEKKLKEYKKTDAYQEYIENYRSSQLEVNLDLELISPQIEAIQSPCDDCSAILELTKTVNDIIEAHHDQNDVVSNELAAESIRLKSITLLHEEVFRDQSDCPAGNRPISIPVGDDRIQGHDMELIIESNLPLDKITELQIYNDRERWSQFFFTEFDGIPYLVRIDHNKDTQESKVRFYRVRSLKGLSLLAKKIVEEEKLNPNTESDSGHQRDQVYGPRIRDVFQTEDRSLALSVTLGAYSTQEEFLEKGPTYLEARYKHESEEVNHQGDLELATTRQNFLLVYERANSNADLQLRLQDYSRLTLDLTGEMIISENAPNDRFSIEAQQDFDFFDDQWATGQLALRKDIPVFDTTIRLGPSHENFEDYSLFVSTEQNFSEKLQLRTRLELGPEKQALWIEGRITLD